MASQFDGKDAADRHGRYGPPGHHGRGEEHRRRFRRASDEFNAAVGALGEWLIHRQWRPILLVKEDLTLISSNRAGREALEKSGWVRQSGRQVEIVDPDLGRQLKSAVDHWPKPRTSSLVLRSSGRMFDLTALALGRHLPKVYVLTILQPPETPVSVEPLLRATGLTDGQAKVAVSIYEGGTLRSIAEELGVTVDAVKSRVKGIYATVGVRSQRELTRWVGELVARETG
jgi:DNA-binding CsgD family transcriptional regulator